MTDPDRLGTPLLHVHGTAAALRSRPATDARGVPMPPVITVAEVLTGWVAADHPWKPSTLVGYRSVVRSLARDPLGSVRAAALTPQVARSAIARWQSAGASVAVVASRFPGAGFSVGVGLDRAGDR